MKHIVEIAGKELSTFFSSLAAYIFFGVFLVAVYFIFFWADPFFVRNTADLRPIFEWMPTLMIFLVSALTMRMWSEELRAGTIESLLTSPVSNLELVAGKFLACLALVVIALALTLPVPVSVALVGPLDWGPVIGGYLASIFLASAYAAIGLFISSRSDNQIVSLILSVVVCAGFVLVGSDALTSLFINQFADILKLLGSGSRFQSITRGVIDFRDLYYYLSITAVFLSLNVLNLEKLRWAGNKANVRHRNWTVVTVLVIANFIAGNIWLSQVTGARLDLTEGHIYSISPVTRKYLANLKEPLLIRAYFSKRTHPFLAPLVPRMRDILKEYAVAGKGKVHLEFVDPLDNPAVEKEAIERYGINPVTFQIASKYQAAVTTSYFDILVKYGDQFETLGYRDLVAVKSLGETNIKSELRNPEYDITRCIKKVMYSYLSSGNPFQGIDQKIEFAGYVSPNARLPEYLLEAKKTYMEILEDLKKKSNGKFTYEFVDPDANGGAVANQLINQFGFRPLPRATDLQPYWFNLTLKDPQKVVALQLPTDTGRTVLERDMKSALRRFSRTFVKTVGLYTPVDGRVFDAAGDYRKFYSLTLQRKLSASRAVMPVDLLYGMVPPQVDLLLVLSPYRLIEPELFAIDQFLMKGGTVIIASSPYDADVARRPLTCRKGETGLEKWLKHHGIEMQEAMVLDPQDALFPVPMTRSLGGVPVEGTEIASYPYFVDVRRDGMNRDGGLTGALDQVTLTWASPIKIDEAKNKQRHVTRLLQSSPSSWTSTSLEIVPFFSEKEKLGFPEGNDRGRKLLAVAVEGGFESYYKGKKSPLLEEDKKKDSGKDNNSGKKKDSGKKGDISKKNDSGKKNDAGKDDSEAAGKGKDAALGQVVEKSPDSARIILFASNTFLSSRVIYLITATLGTQYQNSLELLDNAIDWSLEDRDLLSIRGRGTYARTLKSLTPIGAALFEYSNYLLAACGLALVWFVRRQLVHSRQSKHERLLQAAAKSLTQEGGAS